MNFQPLNPNRKRLVIWLEHKIPAVGWMLFLTVLVIAVFGQVNRFEYVNFDDDSLIFGVAQLEYGWSWEGIKWVWNSNFWYPSGHQDYWSPLPLMTHMVDFQVYGREAGGHHVTSLWIHWANVVLLYVILQLLWKKSWPSFGVAALFAIHPLNVEAVCWLTQRKVLLSTHFALWATWFYLKAEGLPRFTWRKDDDCVGGFDGPMVWCGFFFVLSLTCKVSAVILPALWMLLDVWPLQKYELNFCSRIFWRQGVLRKWWMFCLSIISVLHALHYMRFLGNLMGTTALPMVIRLKNAVVCCVIYLERLVWPSGLTLYYPYRVQMTIWWRVMLGLVVLLGISWICFRLKRKTPCFLMGWLWFLVALFPLSGVVQSGMYAMADRHVYLAMVGIWIGVVWGVWRWGEIKNRKGVVVFILGVMITMFGLSASRQAGLWTNSIVLLENAIHVTKHNTQAYTALLGSYLEKERFDDMFKLCESIHRDFPVLANNQKLFGAVCFNVGAAYIKQGKIKEAIGQFEKAVELYPGYFNAQYNLANILQQTGDFGRAEKVYLRALEINPSGIDASYNLGLVYQQTGRNLDAIRLFDVALKYQPDFQEAHVNLGISLARQGKWDEAMVHYRRALELEPTSAQVYFNIAVCLIRQHRMEEGVKKLRMAVQLAPNFIPARDALKKMVGESNGHQP